MRKILVVSPMIYPITPVIRYGGIERLVRMISGELVYRGYLVSLAAPTDSIMPKGVDHIDTGQCGDFIEAEKRAYWGFRHRLNDFDAILEMSHSHWCMMENDLPGIAFIWHDPLIQKCQEPAYNICSLSRWQRDRFRWVYGYDSEVLDPHCGEVREPQCSCGRYLFIGRLNLDKGVREAVDLCRKTNTPLDIVGGLGVGDSQELVAWLQKNTDGNKINYRGEIDDIKKFKLLTHARALLYPISYPAGMGEAHSHKSVDALLAGCPVIAYDAGALSEVIEHGVTGYLAKTREEFEDYMLSAYLLDRKLIQQKAANKWSVDAAVDRIEPVLEAVASGKRWGKIMKQASFTVEKPLMPSAIGYVKYTLRDFPRQIRLDTINRCPARCIPCHLNFQTRAKGMMPNELFNKIIDDLAGWTVPPVEIVPVNFGEFLLRKDWYEILKTIENKLPHTSIVLPTNGSLLNDNTVMKLTTISTLKWINFSINAFFKETYEAFTGLDVKVIDKIKKTAGQIYQVRPDITTCASMIFDTNYQSEMERDLFIQFWQPLVSLVSINPAAYCDSPLQKPLIPIKTACRSIFDGMTVLRDGTVVTNCCFDASGKLVIGDARKEPLIDIWRGEKLKQICELHNSGKRENIEICAKCTFG